MELPQVIRIRQKFERRIIPKDLIRGCIHEELSRIGIQYRVQAGQSVAVTAGSRGISNIDLITKAVVQELKMMGMNPFIVPAMGSHGGATAHGQLEVLAGLGITEESMGCPIKSSMEVKEVDCSKEGIISYVDKNALEADWIVAVNRVKRHTDIEGKTESGLLKMLCIGLGKHYGAQHYHQAGIDFGMERAIQVGARGVLNNTKVLCGIGIVENAYDETALIQAFNDEDIERGDEELLSISKKWAAHLPFREADILIVDEIGKNISGGGLDTKIVGRCQSVYCAEPEWPKIKKILALDLTESSHGNAIGVGIIDMVNERLVKKIDKEMMYVNAITSQSTLKAAIPMYYPTDRKMLSEALKTIGLVPSAQAKIMRIKNTLMVEEVDVSEVYLPEIENRDDIEIIISAHPIQFDINDCLYSFEKGK